jgi:phenylacetate-CoA ligase
MRESLLRGMVLPLGDRMLGQRMMSRLSYLEAAQWWDRARIAACRDKLLSDLIRTAYRDVPFYRSLLDDNSIKPSDIRAVGNLRKIPVVTKGMLRQGYPGLTTRQTGQKTYESRTSGSTGENFRVLEDHDTAGRYRASFLLALEWAGWRFGERHLQTGMMDQRTLDRRVKDFLLRCHYALATDLTDAALDRHLDWLERTRTRHLWGYPGSLYHLALRAKATGRDLRLVSAITWGDTVYAHYREAIEAAFHTRLFDTYGCAEGMQIAAQCAEGSAYHVHALDVIVEYLDDDMIPVKPGERGNIVVTRLHPGPMPLIRYRIGDVGISGGDRSCSCGRGFELMESIVGRETDVILTPSGNRLIVHFFTGIMEHYPQVRVFQVVQEAPDSLLIRIVPGEGYSESVGHEFVGKLRQAGAADMTIRVQPVDEVPLAPTGKRRFIISRPERELTSTSAT